jgi:hypothetical protein
VQLLGAFTPPPGIGPHAHVWRLSVRWFVLLLSGIFTVLFLVIPALALIQKHRAPSSFDLAMGGVGWVVTVGLTLFLARFIARQGIVAEGDRIWVRTGRRWHGPLDVHDVVAVDLLWARGVGYLYYLISPTVGESLTRRSAFRMLGFIRPGKYRSVHDGPLRYVIIPQWATRDGELFRMIVPTLMANPTVQFNALALRFMMAAVDQRKGTATSETGPSGPAESKSAS